MLDPASVGYGAIAGVHLPLLHSVCATLNGILSHVWDSGFFKVEKLRHVDV